MHHNYMIFPADPADIKEVKMLVALYGQPSPLCYMRIVDAGMLSAAVYSQEFFDLPDLLDIEVYASKQEGWEDPRVEDELNEEDE